jgi:hypothetical protein
MRSQQFAHWKAESLAEELTELFHDVQQSSSPPLQAPPDLTFPDHPLESWEIGSAIRRVPDNSSPGYDQFKVKALKILWHSPSWRHKLDKVFQEIWARPHAFDPFKYGLHQVPSPQVAFVLSCSFPKWER